MAWALCISGGPYLDVGFILQKKVMDQQARETVQVPDEEVCWCYYPPDTASYGPAGKPPGAMATTVPINWPAVTVATARVRS